MHDRCRCLRGHPKVATATEFGTGKRETFPPVTRKDGEDGEVQPRISQNPFRSRLRLLLP